MLSVRGTRPKMTRASMSTSYPPPASRTASCSWAKSWGSSHCCVAVLSRRGLVHADAARAMAAVSRTHPAGAVSRLCISTGPYDTRVCAGRLLARTVVGPCLLWQIVCVHRRRRRVGTMLCYGVSAASMLTVRSFWKFTSKNWKFNF